VFGQVGLTAHAWFKIEAGVRQGCVLVLDSFATGMYWLLDRTVESCSIGVAFGQSSFIDLNFADDVLFLAEMLELFVPILETMASEATSLGLEVNWQRQRYKLCVAGRIAINHQGSGRHGSGRVFIPWLSYPLNNRKQL